MSNTNTGGPAFPAQGLPGMTLRDYFAAKAMQSDLVGGVNGDQFELVARRAYMMADAMLKARNE